VPIKVLECRDVLDDSDCTLTLVGAIDEITEAFLAHAAQRHNADRDLTNEIDAKLQNAVYVSPNKAYIGDDYERVGEDAIHVPGAGMVIQKYAGGDAASDRGSGVTLSCKCPETDTTLKCKLTLSGSIALCENDSCTTCGWFTEIPTHVMPPDELLQA
jgi:hypothetical protein